MRVFGLFLLICQSAAFASAASPPSVDHFSEHALASWVLRAETLPASPETLSKLISDLPAAVRLARTVTGLDYALTQIDTEEFELDTPRGLVVRIRPVKRITDRRGGIFEAVGEGEFRSPNSVFRGRYALRFKYEKRSSASAAAGDFYVYIDVENPILRFLAFFVRGLITERLADEMRRMLSEAKQVMSAAEEHLARGASF